MSGAQTSTFPSQNILYDMATGGTGLSLQHSQNELMQQQQDISGHQIEMGARLASTLLDPTAYPTTEARAGAYPGFVGRARAQFPGYFTNAPDTYPGDAATQALAQLGISLIDRYKLGLTTPPGTQAAIDAALRPGATGATGGGTGGGAAVGGTDTAPINAAGDSRTRKATEGGPPAAGTPAAATAQQVHDFWISKGFSEPVVAGIMAGGPGSESDFNPAAVGDNGSSIGLYQHHGPRADAMRQFFNLSPGQMPSADQQNQYALWEITQGPLKNVGDMLKNAKTPAEAAAIWTQYFGVPADKTEIGRRAAGAQRFVGLYGQPQQGGTGGPTAPAVVTGNLARPGDVPPPPWGAPGAYGGGGMGAAIGGQPAAARATIPAGRPTGPPVITDQPAGSNVVAGPPGTAVVGAPQPPGPAVPGNVAAINAGIVGAGGQPATDPNLTPTPARYAGSAPAPTVEAAPQPGWGTGIGSGYGPQNTLAPAPVPPAPTRPSAAAPRVDSPGAPAAAGLKYNMNSQGAPAGTILGYLPNGNAVLAGPTDARVGITGWNADGTPIRGGAPAATPQPQAQIPQPPANRVMSGGADGPPAAQQPPAPRANLPRAADIPTGVNSQQYQQAADLQRRALILEAQVDPTGRLKQLAAGLRQQAQLLLQTDSVVQTQEGQLHPLTGQIGDPTKPLPHYVYDPTQHAYIDTTGTNKPEFEPAQRDSAVAQRDVMELGPKVANGTATQQEQARYATAVETYRQSKIFTDPITKGLIRVNERELPAGFPEPPGLGGGGRPGGVSAASGPQTITPGMSPAQQEVERKLGENFADQDTKAYAGANNSLYALGQMNNASEILDKQGGSAWTATGPAANLRIATAQGVNTLGSLFGVAPTFDPAAIGSWEALNKQTKLMGFKIINAAFGASREAASVINNATSAVPSAENTYLGFRLVSSGIEQELQRERELYEFKADRVRGGQPLATAEADFNKTHPIDVYTSRAVANAVPDDIAGYLVAHPDTVKAFDGHFGPGIGEFVLKGGRTGLGQAARGR